MPVSRKGTLVQCAGRLYRSCRNKHEVRIVDYVDVRLPVLVRMFEKRLRGYRAMGYARRSPDDVGESTRDYVIEYDEDALRAADSEPF